MMKVLITGVPGWLGNRFLEILTEGFEEEGSSLPWQLRCLVLQDVKYSSFERLRKYKPIEFMTGDITKKGTLKTALTGVDVIFHLAGIIHPKKIQDLYDINTLGTENLLSVAVEMGVKRFIHISSNSVAGTNVHANVLMKESDVPRPYMHYGSSKYKAENLVNAFGRAGKIETVIFRPCWFYGPAQPERQTIFFRMIKKGNPIVFGDGENIRSMSYVDNTCEALLLAAESSVAVGKTYWIADEKPYRTIEIYETIADLLGVTQFKPRYLPDFSSEVFFQVDKILQGLGLYIKEVHVAGEMNKNIACSVDKAKQELGYTPRVSLREGMQRSIEWCKRNGIAI